MNGQWVSGDRGSHIVWELEEHQLSEDKYINTWKVKREEELLFSEIADRAEWGTFYFSAPSVRRINQEQMRRLSAPTDKS